MRKHLIWIVALLSILPVQAQTSRWEDLEQIHGGAKIEVVERSLKSTSGNFVRVSQADLTLEVKGKEVTIQKEQVRRVSVVRTKRKRNALIGLAAGAGAGAGWAVAMRNTENWRPGDSAGLVGGCAGIGAEIGALIASKSTTAVYIADEPKRASVKAASR
ncbi:MAG TPA: hypothetical protein VN577_12410 [Terriglobales bacterium]|nr:hypothetical protein [Terriglobales bacterium]